MQSHSARCIGTFRAGTTTLGSDTASRDQSFSAKRSMVIQKVEQNRISKVGVMDSSQRTSLRVASLGNLRTQFATRNGNDVKHALIRTRNSGAVAPKKKNANAYVSTISYVNTGSDVVSYTVPDPPRNVTLTNISPDLIGIYFNPPLNTGGKQIIYYTITFTAVGRSDIIIQPMITTSLSNQKTLPQGVTYTITVTDTNEVGESSPSTPLSITPISNTSTTIQFTETGEHSWTAPDTATSVSYLVVGGGGGGGGAYDNSAGGGGGAGLVLTGTMDVTPGETYTVIVGEGGTGAIKPTYVSGQGASVNSRNGSSGNSSSFDSIIADGGDFGYKCRTGSGASIPYGGSQANGLIPPTGGSGGNGGGNGGGGGGNGSAGVSTGQGGSGITNNITGTSKTYGKGGNGGVHNSNSSGTVGEVNTGNGGQGGGSFSSNNIGGANGGSGIVVIKFNT